MTTAHGRATLLALALAIGVIGCVGGPRERAFVVWTLSEG